MVAYRERKLLDSGGVYKAVFSLDLQSAEHNMPTQRGVQAYITNLERELTNALRSVETILDILTDPAKSEYSIGDYTVRLCEEDMQKIAVAVGIPEGFKAGSDSGAAHRSLLSFKQRVSELRTFAAARKRIDRHKEFLNSELSLQLAKE